MNKKKIVFVGPPGAGKTTIKKTYFEKANPSVLLKQPLKPSRGLGSSIYRYDNSQLGIFDLAGQENENWLSDKGKEVFNESSIIICIFDIRDSIKSMIDFLVKIFQIKSQLNLAKCKIMCLLHKIDLVNASYSNEKLRELQIFIESKNTEFEYIEIFNTSISIGLFYNTFNIISGVLIQLFEKENFPTSKNEFNCIREELSIILNTDYSINYSSEYLSYKLDLALEDVLIHLKRLERFGLIKNFNNFQYYKLTDRAYYFKVGLEKDQKLIKEKYGNRDIEIFHSFLYLSNISS